MLMQDAQQAASRGARRVWGRIGRCVLTYLLLYVTAWLIIALLFPWEGESFAKVMATSLILLGFIGTPTLCLAICAGLAHRKMEPRRFRGALVAPMLVFAWPVLASSTAAAPLLQVMVQLAFVCFLMPAPLLPEKWKVQA
ncbi:hypothetical protein ACFU5O_32270 [Streptomyces sp. NPDC057445]|uniref:hypothetical protein n=1 Tax=Streptomyces sp. NPDC057445 TaxID=3346136 RepID=UPI0036AA674B